MISYQLIRDIPSGEITSVHRSDGWTIPYDTENSDYQNFKVQINDESAPLYDADGVLMTPDEAKAYVATLP
jgi:hypothetical protein